MGFLQDNLIPIFKKRELKFIESYQESNNVYTFVFEKADDVNWKAGQYGLFSITHKKIKNATKPFSVMSAPNENVIKITTVIRNEPSEFKKALLELKRGMPVSMSGPLGPFYLKDDRPALLIAGGIGITPFRSILKQVESEGAGGRQLQLLYMDSQHGHLFKEELDRMSAAHPALQIAYLESRDGLLEQIDQFAALHRDNGQYFIAGPKSMVDDTAAYLRGKQVSKQQIKKDAFFGY